MTVEHFDQMFAALVDREPFRQFTVELVGGEQFEVDRRSAIIVRDGVGVYLRPKGIPILFDRESVHQIIADASQ